MINRTLQLLLLILAVVAPPGCRPAAQSADPDRARAMLRDALEAWHKGETLKSFRERSSITVAEPKWRDGYRLLEYELTGHGQMSGFDWQCEVRLSLQKASGKSQVRASYNIGTSPTLVIIRYEG